MEAIRQFTRIEDNILTLQLPISFKAKRVEVIVMPIEEELFNEAGVTVVVRRKPSPKLKGTRITGDIMSECAKVILLDTHIWVRWIEPDSDPLPVAISKLASRFDPDEAVGIIGINGAGKSTLLKMTTGTSQATTSSVNKLVATLHKRYRATK